MIWIYCKTIEEPKKVCEYICESNFGQENNGNKPQVINDENEDDCWIIKTDGQNEITAMIYQIGHEIVAIEIDDNCASNVIEPLMKKYGFDKVKWLLTK